MTCPKCHGSTRPCADCAARNFPPDSVTVPVVGVAVPAPGDGQTEERDAGWARRWQADVDGLRAELARVTAERDAACAALATVQGLLAAERLIGETYRVDRERLRAALVECAANLIAVVSADPVADSEAYRATCAALGAARRVLAYKEGK